MTGSARVARAVFPPEQIAEVKALACELPATRGLPLSRYSRTELHRLVLERGLTEASASTIWRWLHDDALKPWQQRSWLFVRDPAFAEKARRVLDLYQRRFEGRRLRPNEYVVCADEKSQLQALGRRHACTPPAPGQAMRVEFDYRRHGTLAYLAAWDVHHANLLDRVEPKTGIEPFGRLVEQLMSSEPYASARTVFLIADNGSSHAGQAVQLGLESGRSGRWCRGSVCEPGEARCGPPPVDVLRRPDRRGLRLEVVGVAIGAGERTACKVGGSVEARQAAACTGDGDMSRHPREEGRAANVGDG